MGACPLPGGHGNSSLTSWWFDIRCVDAYILASEPGSLKTGYEAWTQFPTFQLCLHLLP